MQYQVKTETKGLLEFNELPENTYFAAGYQDPNDKGKAYLFIYDNGTLLIPIMEGENFVYTTNPAHFGKNLSEIGGKVKLPANPKVFYKVVKIGRVSARKTIIRKNLSLDEAKRLVNASPDSSRSMLVFYKQ